jgi:hypothetical protein
MEDSLWSLVFMSSGGDLPLAASPLLPYQRRLMMVWVMALSVSMVLALAW